MTAVFSGMTPILDKFTTDFYMEHVKLNAAKNMKTEHYHDFYEIYFYLGDGMKYFIGNKTFFIKKYDLVLIDKFTYHKTSYDKKSPKERVLVYFDDSLLKAIETFGLNPSLHHDTKDLFSKKKVSFNKEFGKTLYEKLINQALVFYHEGDSNSGNLIQAKLIVSGILLELIEMNKAQALFEDDFELNSKEKRIEEIVTYIDLNFQEKITLKDLTSRFFVSKYYLCHSFKEITGMSITEFISRKRLAESKKLLKTTGHDIRAISEMVGFNNASRFISLFREKYGVTPKTFREKL